MNQARVPTSRSCPSRPRDDGEIAYKIAQNRLERIAAFQLVYRNYLEKGLIRPNPYEMRVTPFHLLPTTTVFIASQGGRVISTVTLIGDGNLGIPMDATNSDVVSRLRLQGYDFGEVSCLAFEETASRRFLPVFIQLTRLMAQYARAHGMDQFLIATVPEHARFYQRFLGFEQVGREQPYPTVCNTRGVACCLDFAQIDRDRPPCYDQYFGEPLPGVQQKAAPMTSEEIEEFRPIAEYAFDLMPALA